LKTEVETSETVRRMMKKSLVVWKRRNSRQTIAERMLPADFV
jgi:hypothetical protein